MDNFYVYALENKIREKIYIGYMVDLDSRIKRHNGILKNKKKSFTGKNSGLWELVYSEIFKTRQEAMKREKELKSFRGREFIRNIIKQNTRR